MFAQSHVRDRFVAKARTVGDPFGRESTRLNSAERRIAQAYERSMNELADRLASTEQVEALLQAGVFAAIPAVDSFDWSTITGSVMRALSDQVSASGVAGVRELPQVFGKFSFDKKDFRAVRWAEEAAGNRIVAISQETRRTVRNLVATALREGRTTAQTARDLRQVIGLTPRQARSVQTGFVREYDRLVAAGVRDSVANERASRVAVRAHNKALSSRAKSIARTEIATAANQGRYLSFQQAVEGGFASADARKRWVTGPLNALPGKPTVCNICAPLQGQTVKWNETFANGTLMPPAHPNCRCTAVMLPPDRK